MDMEIQTILTNGKECQVNALLTAGEYGTHMICLLQDVKEIVIEFGEEKAMLFPQSIAFLFNENVQRKYHSTVVYYSDVSWKDFLLHPLGNAED